MSLTGADAPKPSRQPSRRPQRAPDPRRRLRRLGLLSLLASGCLGVAIALAAPEKFSAVSLDAEPGFDRAAIARLNVQGVGQCSAILIGPQLALTAAHCLRHPVSRRLVRADRVHLLFGYERGAWTAHRQVEAYRVSPAFETEAAGPEEDWALLRFAQPVDAVRPAQFAEARTEPPAALSAAGYAAPRREVLELRSGCALHDRLGDLLAIGCAIAQGGSGGPVFDALGRLVGVLVATATHDGEAVGLVAVMDRERATRLLAGLEPFSGAARAP